MTSINQQSIVNKYIDDRQLILDKEQNDNFESDTVLNERERIANEIIMRAKRAELKMGFKNPALFAPSRNFLEVGAQIDQSKLFQILKRMPKGGILHAHDTALTSIEYIVSLTYLEHLWQCNDENGEIVAFKFSRNAPKSTDSKSSDWRRVCDERNRIGKERYDKQLFSLFTLRTANPDIDYKDINSVWARFMGIFILFEPIATYAPVWKAYYKEALRQMYADGVQYVELRSILPKVYDLDGKTYSAVDVVQLYADGLKEYMLENPDFIGSRIIYAPLKNVDDTTFRKYLEIAQELHKKFPDLIAGFDLVGQEDLGRPLIEFTDELLKLPKNLKYFLHAGETNWSGLSSDENLIDAILLGTHRIGHGFALSKHPELLRIIKEKDIPIEVNPISNQVLKLVGDLRNHPAAIFLANNVPIVISSDDPSFWEALPLTHDFYAAFLGICSAHSDLRTLKKLAMNSIKYSAMTEGEKEVAFSKWQIKWDQFIDSIKQFK